MLRLIVVLVVLGIPTLATAQQLDDVGKGLAYAIDHCAECHAVVRGKHLSPAPQAPAFEDIAKTPGMTGTALTVWLRTSHPTMPNFIIPPSQVDSLIAYILSLQRPQWWKPKPTNR